MKIFSLLSRSIYWYRTSISVNEPYAIELYTKEKGPCGLFVYPVVAASPDGLVMDSVATTKAPGIKCLYAADQKGHDPLRAGVSSKAGLARTFSFSYLVRLSYPSPP